MTQDLICTDIYRGIEIQYTVSDGSARKYHYEYRMSINNELYGQDVKTDSPPTVMLKLLQDNAHETVDAVIGGCD